MTKKHDEELVLGLLQN